MSTTPPLNPMSEGNALMRQGLCEEAVACYDRAIAEKSDNLFAYFNRGQALKKLKRFDEAVYSFALAIALRPTSPDLYEIFGGVLSDLGRHEAAVNIFGQGLELDPASFSLRKALGKSLLRLARHEAALDISQEALAAKPDDAEVINTLAGALFSLKRYAESVPHYRRLTQLYPDAFNSHFNLALSLNLSGEVGEAVEVFDRAQALKPDDNKTFVNRAICRLKLGDFAQGWAGYESRKDYNTRYFKAGFDKPEWRGEDLAGKTILVHAEFGLGDTLQFSRYLPLLEARGTKVLLAPQPSLAGLMRTISPTVEIVDVDDPDLVFDVHVRMMSLPGLFGATLETIPAEVPYLRAEPERVARWVERLDGEGIKVGVCWRGSRLGDERGLSFAIGDLTPLAAIPGVRLISLQKTGDPEERQALARQTAIEVQLDPADLSPDAMLDTAALIEACDLVISCDTSIAHLAGAMGRPTWVVMPVDGDWRWLHRRDDSPWYPTVRLFRPGPGETREVVFAALEAALRERAASDA